MKAWWKILLLVCAMMIGACTNVPASTQVPVPTQPVAPAGETAGPHEVAFQTEDGVTLERIPL